MWLLQANRVVFTVFSRAVYGRQWPGGEESGQQEREPADGGHSRQVSCRRGTDAEESRGRAGCEALGAAPITLLPRTLLIQLRDADESEYRWKIDRLNKWCQNNLAHYVSKTKELIVDIGRGRMSVHKPVFTDGILVGTTSSFWAWITLKFCSGH